MLNASLLSENRTVICAKTVETKTISRNSVRNSKNPPMSQSTLSTAMPSVRTVTLGLALRGVG